MLNLLTGILRYNIIFSYIITSIFIKQLIIEWHPTGTSTMIIWSNLTVSYENDYFKFPPPYHDVLGCMKQNRRDENKGRLLRIITLGILIGFLEAYSHSFPIFLSLGSATWKSQ